MAPINNPMINVKSRSIIESAIFKRYFLNKILLPPDTCEHNQLIESISCFIQHSLSYDHIAEKYLKFIFLQSFSFKYPHIIIQKNATPNTSTMYYYKTANYLNLPSH